MALLVNRRWRIWPATLQLHAHHACASSRAHSVQSIDGDDDELPFDLDDDRWDALLPDDEPYERQPELGDFWIEADDSVATDDQLAARAASPNAA